MVLIFLSIKKSQNKMLETPKKDWEFCAKYLEIKNTEIHWKECTVSVRIGLIIQKSKEFYYKINNGNGGISWNLKKKT